MRKRIVPGALLLALMGIGCGSDGPTHGADSAKSVREALDVVGLKPVPRGWQGSYAQLEEADALASGCARMAGPNKWELEPVVTSSKAPRMVALLEKMNDDKISDACLTVPRVGKGLLEWWSLMRKDASCNVDPMNPQEPAKASGMKAIGDMFNSGINIWSAGTSPANQTDTELYTPMIHACLAMRIREAQASGADAILLNEKEMQGFGSAVLEHSSRAMMGYAALGVAAVSRPAVPELNGQLQLIRYRITNEIAQKMGKDFAAVVQLHSIAATEMMASLRRSANARSKRDGADPKTVSEELWGRFSYRQEAMSMLYGGDYTKEITPDALVNDPTELSEWPNILESPFPRFEVREPEVHLFRSLVQANLASVPLTVTTLPPSTCAAISADATGQDLYDLVEKRLQAVPPATVGTLPSSLDNYLLWKNYRVRRDHAVGYARYLADMLDPICVGPIAHTTGSASAIGSIWAETDGKVHISSDMVFEPKGMEQRASTWARLVPFRMPERAALGLVYDYPVFMGDQETMGCIGAVSAQVAVREALHAMKMESVNGGSAAMYAAFAGSAGKMLDLINATVGQTAVALRPSLESWTSSTGIPSPVPVCNLNRCDWEVDLVIPKSDSWWDASGISVVAVPNAPWLANRLKAPSQKAFMADAAATIHWAETDSQNPNQSAVLAAVADTVEDAEGLSRRHATLTLSQASIPAIPGRNTTRWTFVAKKGGTVPSYRLIAADVHLPKLVSEEKTGNNPSLNIGQYIGVGGKLGDDARKLMEPSRDNPTQPAFDGFGLPTNFMPPTDPTLFGGSQGESAVSHGISNGKAGAQEATGAVNTAIQGLLDELKSEADLKAASKRSAAVNRMERDALCGSGNTKCKELARIEKVALLEWKASWLAGLNDACPNTLAEIGTIPNGIFPNAIPDNLSGGQLWFRVFTGIAEAPQAALDSQCSDTFCSMVRFYQTTVGASIGQSDPAPKFKPEDLGAAAALYCRSLDVLRVYAGQVLNPSDRPTIQVAKAVFDTRTQSVVPSFSDFAGGSLQPTLIEQWSSLKSVQDLADEYILATDAAVQKFLTAASAANAASENYRQQCNSEKEFAAIESCFSVSCGIPSGCSVSYNPGPLNNYHNNCEMLLTNAGPAIQGAVAEKAEATLRVGAYAGRFTDATKTAQLASAKMNQLLLATQQAEAKNNLEVELLAGSQPTSFGLYRRFHSADLWRAKALVESARQQAVVARRAVESRFGVDLGTMTAPEPFVASPSSWADEVYGVDLSLPAAVGLSVGNANQSGIYANKLTDYMGNLERFVQGFAVARPSAAAHEDTEIVSVPGPFQKVEHIDPLTGQLKSYPEDSATRWEVLCPGTPTAEPSWKKVMEATLLPDTVPCMDLSPTVPMIDPDAMCWNATYAWSTVCTDSGLRPIAARTRFILDPWARREGVISNEPFEKRYNVRWTRLAVNLVGTGLRDCAKSASPQDCYMQSFLRYNLTHVGPSWISNYDQQWRVLGTPLGAIEGAKALAAEQWLDPVGNGWAKPYVEAVSRSEFTERPVGGIYELQIQLAPEDRLDRLERVQVLLGTSYWVKQK